MALADDLKRFAGGGIDTDSAPEYVAPNDAISRVNLRNTGTGGQELGYDTNIESNELLSGGLLAGFNGGIGGGAFEDTGTALCFRYNSAGKSQLLLYDNSTKSYSVVYEDLTDSGALPLLPLTPDMWVTCVLINKTYALWTANGLEVGFTNLHTLKSGGYGTLLWEDLSLLKPQIVIPPTGVYGSDNGKPANRLYGKLPQFLVFTINADFNYSACSTRSKRIVPYQQNTPIAGSDVSQNNYIIITTDIGSIRAQTLNIAAQFDDSGDFVTIKTVTRDYIIALPNSAVDVDNEIYEAYDAGSNTYSFAWYNDEQATPLDANFTDLFYDYIWLAATNEKINGNIVALADWKIPNDRPVIPVTIAAVGYNANIGIPAGTYVNPMKALANFPGASGSGAGGHKRVMWVKLGGSPNTGDSIVIITADIRNSNATQNVTYIVPSGQSGNLAAVVASVTTILNTASYVDNGDGTFTITFIGLPYYGLQTFSVELFFAGPSVSNSIPNIPDNTILTGALSYRDYKGRPFPLVTDNSYIINTPSRAQVNGQALRLSVTIGQAAAPPGAVDVQFLLTQAPISKIVETLATTLTYKGVWDAVTNTPHLAINSGTIGDTYQITTPAGPVVTGTYTNLGDGSTYNTGDYVTNIGGSSAGSGAGQSYAVIPKTFGDLTSTGSIMAFSLNPLALYNQQYNQQAVSTNLVYDFAEGDRCTLDYYIDGTGAIVYFNQPCIDLAVLGYDAGTYTVKLEKSAALNYSSGHIYYNGIQIDGFNIFLRLYSPQPIVADQKETVWYETGERMTITNGIHDVLTFNVDDGGVYYKTRQFADGPGPYTNPPVQVLATDLNYSDFYVSNYWSKGRARTLYDVLENTEQKASIITSQNYISGSRVNGLNRFYPELIYGDGNGQCSSSAGSIRILWQRGNVLVAIQDQNVFYIPVNEAYTVLNEQTTGQSISEKLLNNGRYATENIGIGSLKESFWKRNQRGGFIAPYLSEPVELGTDGVLSISGKNSKYFKSVIQAATAFGKRQMQYYDTFYEEVVLCIQSASGIIRLFPFGDDWNPNDSYVILPGNFTSVNNGAHCTAAYNAGTGIVTYTPATDYVGGDSANFSFNPGSGVITKTNCLQWTAGNADVNPFTFMALDGVPLSTVQTSNTILVFGNDIPAPISITGDTGLGYSVNGGAFTSSPGFVNSGDTVQVRVTSSGSNTTATNCTLTIDSQSATFTVTTAIAGNFTAYAQYGMKIVSIVNGTGSGVPAGYNPCNLTAGQAKSAAYTTLTTGTYIMTLDGTPTIPGHVEAFMSVNGVDVQVYNIIGSTILTFTLGAAANDPDVVLFSIRTHS